MARKPSPRRKAAKAEKPGLFPEGEPEGGAKIPDDFPVSWAEVLADQFRQPYFATLQRFVAEEREKGDVFPPDAEVYNAFRYTPFDAVKVVLLGQDPYPT